MSINMYAKNHIFNHDFFIPGPSKNFPAGWQKHKTERTSSIACERNDKNCCIRIKNRSNQMVSICQQRTCSIPVDKGQVWKVTAKFTTEEVVHAMVIVHFVEPSSRSSNMIMDFTIEPDSSYYTGIISIPAGAEYAFMEIGLKEAGIIWIEEVEFIKVFPVVEYNTDHRGRLNINTVEHVKNIIEPVVVQSIAEPVKIQGTFNPTKPNMDSREDVVAGPSYASSKVQDILLLTTYSFCVLNLGTNSVKVCLQISPDTFHWIDEPGSSYSINAGENKILVCNYFLRYIRVAFIVEYGGSSNLRIFFQGNG